MELYQISKLSTGNQWTGTIDINPDEFANYHEDDNYIWTTTKPKEVNPIENNSQSKRP